MKRLLPLFAPLLALGCAAEVSTDSVSQALLGFAPVEGIYDSAWSGPEPENPTCTTGSGGTLFVPALGIALGSDGDFTMTHYIAIGPGGAEVPVAVQDCSFNGAGNGFKCIGIDSVNDFSVIGFDAIISVDNEDWVGAWTSATTFQYFTPAGTTVTCEGSDCPFLEQLIGDFDCMYAPSGEGYALRQ